MTVDILEDEEGGLALVVQAQTATEVVAMRAFHRQSDANLVAFEGSKPLEEGVSAPCLVIRAERRLVSVPRSH